MKNLYFIFAGESSGDLHGSGLIRALKASNPLLTIEGVGGPLMREQDLKQFMPMENFQVMGFTDVLKSLPRLTRHFYSIRDYILSSQPDCVILIDYPGFNLRLAKSLRKKNYQGKIIQYICPTVWAHGRHRIKTMIENLDLLLTIFPFESDYFSNSPLPVKYVGNPLSETIHNHSYVQDWRFQIGIPENTPLIAIFPGSRIAEIQRNLPTQLIACAILKHKHPEVQFGLSYAHENLLNPIQDILNKSSLKLQQDIHLIPQQFSYELMKDCHTALAKSGTVTLELALHQRPTLVMYQLTRLNYFIAKYILRINLPYYCLTNILARKEIFPELFDKKILSTNVYEHLEKLYTSELDRARIQSTCKTLIDQLGHSQSHSLAAQAIVELLV